MLRRVSGRIARLLGSLNIRFEIVARGDEPDFVSLSRLQAAARGIERATSRGRPTEWPKPVRVLGRP